MEIIILAAGLGTRMKSEIPKVLHSICGEPILSLLLREVDQALLQIRLSARLNIVVGHGRDHVISLVRSLSDSKKIKTPCDFTVQEKQLGTGHAVQLALANPSSYPTVAVLNGDLPLFRAADFLEIFESHKKTKSVASLASMVVHDPAQYGRILRSGKKFSGVVEFKDANAKQRAVKEVNGGVYFFDRAFADKALAKVKNKNAGGEFYLPDLFSIASKEKKKIYAHCLPDGNSLLGVNTTKELAHAQKVLFQRTAERWMSEGVFLATPDESYIGPRVSLEKGCSIGPSTLILGESKLSNNVRVGAHCELVDTVVGENSVIRNSTFAEKAQVGSHCSVGPMAHLRPGTVLRDHVRVGNFVEIKESQIGSHTSAAHLSYIGDAEIGEKTNLGCGFITCNFDGQVRDGKRKHHTKIGNSVFMGSDCQVVAPIEIADGTYVASGSTVTDSVKEKDSLVLARTRQVTKSGYAKKYKT